MDYKKSKKIDNVDDYIVFNKDNYINKLDAGEDISDYIDWSSAIRGGKVMSDIEYKENSSKDDSSRGIISVSKHFLILLEKIENSNKWIVEDGSENTFEVINETNDNDYTEGYLIAVRLRKEQKYLIEQKTLHAKYFVEEVLATYKSVFEIESEQK